MALLLMVVKLMKKETFFQKNLYQMLFYALKMPQAQK